MDAQLTFEDITPEMAEEYLQHNMDSNRNLLGDRVSRLVRDMKAGDWVTTADPIKFNTAGKLIDGQHRLTAIVSSGTTQRVLVARGVNDDAVYVVDTGAPRTAAQALRIADSTLTNKSTGIAAAQIVNAYDHGALKHAGSQLHPHMRMTTTEVIHYLQERREDFEAASRMAKDVARSLPLASSQLAAAHVILAQIDPEATDMFFTAIRAGSSGQGEDDPVAVPIRRAYQDKLAGRRITVGTALFYILRTWNAWRAGEPLSKLQTGSAGGFAALPTPK